MGTSKSKEDDWGLGKEELQLYTEYMGKVIESVKTVQKSIIHFFNDSTEPLDEEQKNAIRLEKEADDIKLKIIGRLAESGSHPRVRENFMNLTFVSDEIPENARAAVVKLSNLRECNPGDEIKKDLQGLTDLSGKAVDKLREAVSELFKRNFKESIDKAEEVEDIEGKGDRLRRTKLNPKISDWAEEESNPATVGLFMDMISNIEETVDQAEKASNIVRTIAIGQL